MNATGTAQSPSNLYSKFIKYKRIWNRSNSHVSQFPKDTLSTSLSELCYQSHKMQNSSAWAWHGIKLSPAPSANLLKREHAEPGTWHQSPSMSSSETTWVNQLGSCKRTQPLTWQATAPFLVLAVVSSACMIQLFFFLQSTFFSLSTFYFCPKINSNLSHSKTKKNGILNLYKGRFNKGCS